MSSSVVSLEVSNTYLFLNLKCSKLVSSSDWNSPLRFNKHDGGRNLANCPRAVGVEHVLSGGCQAGKAAGSGGGSSPEEEELELQVESISGLAISANVLVVAQNKKLPRMLPWGEPPGTVRGLEYWPLILTDIFLLCKNAATQSIAC